MEFGLSAEQALFQDSLDRFLEANGSLAAARLAAASGDTRPAALIGGLADLGVTGLLVPEAYGGLGLGALDAAVASERFGARVTPAPFISAFALAPAAIAGAGDEAVRSEWLAKIAEGRAVVGSALSELSGARADAGVQAADGRLTGRALFVIDFDADAYVVADTEHGLHLVEADAPGLQRIALRTVDATRATGELVFDSVRAVPLDPPGAAKGLLARRLLDLGRVLHAADALGAALCMLDQAVAYAKERRQFGRVIGSFQAVKHMCAEMAASLEPCRALVWYAAHALEALPDEASVTACHAKVQACEAATRAAKAATEVHGGMGFTDLVGLHYWFKRVGADRQMLGGPQAVRADAARLQGWAA